MVTATFDKSSGEKLEYTFDFTADLDAISQTIEGTPTIVVSAQGESVPALVTGTSAVDVSNKKFTVTFSAGSNGVDYLVTCKANATGAPDRDFEQQLILRIRPSLGVAVGGLTTVGRVIAELNITDAAQQSLVADLIMEATDAIQTYCNRTFARQEDISEKVAGYGGSTLVLNVTPVISVDSVSAFDNVLAATDYEIEDAEAGFLYFPYGVADTGRTNGNTLSGVLVSNSEQKAYTVVYTGGYILPGQPGRTLPYDLERACIEMIRTIRTSRADASIKSKSIPGVVSIEYNDVNLEDGSIPGHIAKMVNPYRRLA